MPAERMTLNERLEHAEQCLLAVDCPEDAEAVHHALARDAQKDATIARLRGLIVEMVESQDCRTDNPSWGERADAALAETAFAAKWLDAEKEKVRAEERRIRDEDTCAIEGWGIKADEVSTCAYYTRECVQEKVRRAKAEEREACAKVADARREHHRAIDEGGVEGAVHNGAWRVAGCIAREIRDRQRGEQGGA